MNRQTCMVKPTTCPRCAAALTPTATKCPRCAFDLSAAMAAADELGSTVVGDELGTDNFPVLRPDATMVDDSDEPMTEHAPVPDTGENPAHEVDTDERRVPEMLQPGGEIITDKRVALEALQAAREMPTGEARPGPPVLEEAKPKSRAGLNAVPPANVGARRTITGERPLTVPRRALATNPEAKRAPLEASPRPKKSPLFNDQGGTLPALPPVITSPTREADIQSVTPRNGHHSPTVEVNQEHLRAASAAATPAPVQRAEPLVPRPNVPAPPAHRPATNAGRVVDSLLNAQLGEYIIAERIGVGGMGIVYRAKQPMIGTNVAIKVLRPDVLSDPRDVERLLHEAKVVNQIKHRGIISIFGAGKLPDDRQYLVMEYLEGETLEKRLEREGQLKPEVVVPILDEVLAALGAAHDAGIVHRDLKPANVFLIKQSDGRPWVKLLDFGLARRNTNDVSRIAGTPDYISPEHARGRPAGPPTDIYAVGILAFHLLTGQLPFKGNSPMEVMEKHVHSAPPDPLSINPNIPPILSGFALKLLEKDPSKRPDAKQARKDLKAAFKELNFSSHMHLEPVKSPSAMVPDRQLVHTVGVSEAEVDPRLKDLSRRADRKKYARLLVQHWPWVAGLVAIVWVVGVAIYLLATPAPPSTIPSVTPIRPKPGERHGPPDPAIPIPRDGKKADTTPPSVQEVPIPVPPEEKKPEEAKAVEAKPEETKPAEETKPVAEEHKPEDHKAKTTAQDNPEAWRKSMGDNIDAQEARLDEKLTNEYKPSLENLRRDINNSTEVSERHELLERFYKIQKNIKDNTP